MKGKNDLRVFVSMSETRCNECGEDLDRASWIKLQRKQGTLCLACADLDHLVFLPSGDAALARTVRRYSILSAVVFKWGSTRKWYERQGLLVEEEGLARAEQDCLVESEARERRRMRLAERRAELDPNYVEQFAMEVRALYPGCPPGREKIIAEQACLKYRRRLGRSGAVKVLDLLSVNSTVWSHVRHSATAYDFLLAGGMDRLKARTRVDAAVGDILVRWGAIEMKGASDLSALKTISHQLSAKT